jgi:hypothetical protein
MENQKFVAAIVIRPLYAYTCTEAEMDITMTKRPF